jgi:import inner membrane translocase subunit TIM23
MNNPDIDLSTVAPMLGVSAGDDPDYLDYDIKGRGFFEKLFFQCGSSYLIGMGGGGLYGAGVGLRTAASPLFRVRVNALMNGCSKYGSRVGNSFGVLALMYTSFEWGADQLELDRYAGGYDFVNPITAGACTGLMFKSTAGPKPMLLAGVLGGSLVGLSIAAAPTLDALLTRRR